MLFRWMMDECSPLQSTHQNRTLHPWLPKRVIVGTQRCHNHLLGCNVQHRLLHVVGAVRQRRECYIERDLVFGLAHVGVDVDSRDLLTRAIDGDHHLVTRLRVIRERQVDGSRRRVPAEREVVRAQNLLHLLRIGWNVHGQQ